MTAADPPPRDPDWEWAWTLLVGWIVALLLLAVNFFR